MLTQEHVQAIKHGADGAAVAVAGLSLVGYAPAFAAVMAGIWYGVQAYYLVKDKMNKKRSQKRRQTDA